MPLSNQDRKAKRREAQSLDVTVTVGKNGITPETIVELQRHLKKHKLVKVRLLLSASEGGQEEDPLAQALVEATGAELVERRGHTAVFWRG